jgi:putative esterase
MASFRSGSTGVLLRVAVPLLLLAVWACSPTATARGRSEFRFEVELRPGMVTAPQDGRLLILFGRPGGGEPRKEIGLPGDDALPILGRDVRGLAPGGRVEVDSRAAVFPASGLAGLPAGEYLAQALLTVNRDLRGTNQPGDLYGDPVKIRHDPRQRQRFRLELTRQEPPDAAPPDTDLVKYLRLPSRLLSDFHGRPIYLRAAVILPKDYGTDPSRRYPLRIHIGGYGARYSQAAWWMEEGSEFRRAWEEKGAPSMLLLLLDGAGPFGDPYQVNSANNGPYGDAVTRELIPAVEERFHGIGTPASRVLDGASTGGWVSLALQIFYPDFFGGTWSYCPDGVDFRGFQLLDIYSDENAYVNAHGAERPSARDINGDTLYTMRREVQMENVLGASDRWTLSGGQWGAWNATYGPKGPDGMPAPLWDPVTGKIDRRVPEAWKKYDLRLVLEQRWPELGPKLQGKIHIWVGDADTYFLNNAVHLLDDFLAGASPPYGGSITYGPRKEHCWMGLSEKELMARMAAAAGSGLPGGPGASGIAPAGSR